MPAAGCSAAEVLPAKLPEPVEYESQRDFVRIVLADQRGVEPKSIEMVYQALSLCDTIDVAGNRAIAQTKMTISQRASVEGTFRVPDGTRVTRVQVRILEDGVDQPRSSQTMVVS